MCCSGHYIDGPYVTGAVNCQTLTFEWFTYSVTSVLTAHQHSNSVIVIMLLYHCSHALFLFYFCKSDVSAVQGHPRSLILVRIESYALYACDFLIFRHSNLGPILHHFGDIADFLCS